MNASLRTLAVTALASGAVAVGALAMSAPAIAKPLHTATSIQPTCEQSPGLYGDGAVLGVYSTQRRGSDRDQICKVYAANNTHIGTYTSTDYGYYQFDAQQSVPPVKSAR